MASPMSKGAVKEKVSTHCEVAMVTSATGSAYLRRRKESWMRGQQMSPLNNVYQHVNSKLGRQHTWAPLAAAFHLFAYCAHSTNNVNDAWKLATPTESTSPTIFEQWCGFFYVPQEPGKCKCCETGPTVFRPYPRRLESLTICRCHYKGSPFFSVIQRHWVLVRLGFEPATSRSADRHSPNWANQAAVLTRQR